MPSTALVEVWFINHTTWWATLPHKVLSSPVEWSKAWTLSSMVLFPCSANPLCYGVSCTVSFCFILSPSIWVECLYVHIKLGAAPCFIVLIGLKSVTLLCEEVNICETGFVIHKSDVISLFPFSFDWHRSPEVTMHLSGENISSVSFPCLWNDLPSCLRIHTRLTEEWVSWQCWSQSYAGNKFVFDKFLCNYRGHVSQTMVEMIQGKRFLNCIYLFNVKLMPNFV